MYFRGQGKVVEDFGLDIYFALVRIHNITHTVPLDEKSHVIASTHLTRSRDLVRRFQVGK
jgi:hypothetical protein